MTIIVDIYDKDRRHLQIDEIRGQYYITVDDEMVQRNLQADAVIRWMGNCMHTERQK